MAPVLAVNDLRVTYHGRRGDVAAVRGIDFDVEAGRTLALVGESGSGKSTVAAAITGLLPRRGVALAGSIRLAGRELVGRPSREWRSVRGRRIAMVFQDPMTSLNPYLTIGDQVAEVMLTHRLCRRPEAHRRTIDALARLEVPDADLAFSRYPHQLSGGMRQRVMIAAALAGSPDLLIADEPTTALDVINQDRILRLLCRETRDRAMAVLLITHDLGIVAGLADEVVVMKDGQAVERAGVLALYAAPQAEYTRRLLAAVPRLDRHPADGADLPAAAAPPPPPSPYSVPCPEAALLEVDRAVVEFRRQPSGWLSGEGARFRAVDGVSLRIGRGEVLGIVGQSGSGKSTLVRAVVGLCPLASGTVRLAGQVIDYRRSTALRAVRRQAQLVFQDPLASLNARMTAERIIAEPLVNFHRIGWRDATLRARDLMRLVQLDAAWGGRFPHEFSGGQCQRIGIARALAIEPQLLLCDEPVSGLDVSVQAEILRLLTDLRDRLGVAILFISHDLAVVRHLADRVGVMQQGRLVELQSAASLYAHATHPYTRSLMAAAPIPDPTVYRLTTGEKTD